MFFDIIMKNINIAQWKSGDKKEGEVSFQTIKL